MAQGQTLLLECISQCRLSTNRYVHALKQSVHTLQALNTNTKTDYINTHAEKEGKETVLEVLEVSADLKPLGGVPVHVVGAKERGDDGWNHGAVLLEPISLQNASELARIIALLGPPGDDGDLGEVRQGQGVYRRLLGVEVGGDLRV